MKSPISYNRLPCLCEREQLKKFCLWEQLTSLWTLSCALKSKSSLQTLNFSAQLGIRLHLWSSLMALGKEGNPNYIMCFASLQNVLLYLGRKEDSPSAEPCNLVWWVLFFTLRGPSLWQEVTKQSGHHSPSRSLPLLNYIVSREMAGSLRCPWHTVSHMTLYEAGSWKLCCWWQCSLCSCAALHVSIL